MLKLILNEKGDTIVEVLIAMVILAFVLTGAYTSAQASFNNISNAENRITGLNIASGQIEALKELLASNPTSINTSNNLDFYMSNGKQVSGTESTIQNTTFYYDFSNTTYVTTDNADDYIFTVNVYWRDLDFNPVNNSCSSSNFSDCDQVSVSYQAAI
jgi:Tfp pilus assembly protein PilV